MLELKQLRKNGSVKEYQFAFDRLLAQSSLTTDQPILCYLDSLKDELVNSVMMHKP